MQFPEHIEFMEQIPLTKAGKVDKNALKEEVMRKVHSALSLKAKR